MVDLKVVRVGVKFYVFWKFVPSLLSMLTKEKVKRSTNLTENSVPAARGQNPTRVPIW